MTRTPIAWLLAAALLLGACQPADQARAPAATPTPVATPAPAATPSKPLAERGAMPAVPTLQVTTWDGANYDLAQRRGKWVVVNFWATWCNPCLKEIPDLDAFDQSREDVEVIGLAYEEIEKADMDAFLKEHPMRYPIAVVDVYNPPADFDIPKGLPMTYLIAPDGKVAKQFLGPVTSAEIAAVIETAAKSSGPM